MGRAVAVVLVFEEGEVSGLVEDDDDRSVLEVVVVVVSFLPSPSLLVVSFLAVVLLDCIGTVEGLIVFGARVLEFFVVASGADNLVGQRGRGRLSLSGSACSLQFYITATGVCGTECRVT